MAVGVVETGYPTILGKWMTDKTGIETVKINRS